MPLTAKWIDRQPAKEKEQWIPVADGSGCYLVISKSAKARKRFVGMSRIGLPKGKRPYKVPLGFWGTDFKKPSEVLQKWEEMKRWGKENNCDLRKYGERLNLNKSETTLEEVFNKFYEWKKQHIKDSDGTYRNRLNQILNYLPDGMLVDELAGYEGTQLIKEIVLNPSIAKGHPKQAMRHRRFLNNIFDYAVADRLIHPDRIPFQLNKPFPFEANLPKEEPHPHLSWDECRSKLIPDLNQNHCNADRLVDLATKAVLLMPTRVSAVVSMEWSWLDADKKCWVIPADTTGVKRSFGDTTNDHYIPHTPQLETLMNALYAINGKQKYIFFSPYKGSNPYLSKQTPNDHLKNLGYGKNGIRGKQDAHGFRHLATNTLVDEGGFDEKMVSRCLGHLHNDGAIGHYDFAERIQQRREIHEYWNQLLIKEGLRI